MAFNETKSPAFNFEVFYDFWQPKFNKRSDPLFLFFHYLLVQNGFQALQTESENVNELLSERHKEIAYLKKGEKYRFEAFESKKDLIVIFRNVVGIDDGLLKLKVCDFIHQDFRSTDYNMVFNGERFGALYICMQNCIDMVQRIDRSYRVNVYTFCDYDSTIAKKTKAPVLASTDSFKKPLPVPVASSSQIALSKEDASFREHSIKPCQVVLKNIAPELASMAKLVRGKTRYSIKKVSSRRARQTVKVEPTQPTRAKRPREQSIKNSAAKRIKIEL